MFIAIFGPIALAIVWAAKSLIMNWVITPAIRRNAEQRALARRREVQSHTNGKESAVRVRQTDIEENLSRDDWQRRRMAEEMIARGEIVEAARVLESIRFQRRAVDILEKNGYIDEAAETLLRLGVTNRAAVLFERNGRFAKAGDLFQTAGMPEKAGETYLKLAHQDYSFYLRAADSFESSRNINRMLECLAVVLQTDRIVFYCLAERQYEFLCRYLSDPLNALRAFQKMTDAQVTQLVTHCLLVPSTTQAFVNWVNLLSLPEVTARVMMRVTDDERAMEHFWKSLTPTAKQTVLSLLKQQKEVVGFELIAKHADCLRRLSDYPHATDLYRIIHHYHGVAMVLVDSGELLLLVQWLRKIEKINLAQDVETALADKTEGPWDRDIVARICEIIAVLPGPAKRRPTELSGEMPKHASQYNLEKPVAA